MTRKRGAVPSSRSRAPARRRRLPRGSRIAPPRVITLQEGGKIVPSTDHFGDWDLDDRGSLICWRTTADTAKDLSITVRRLQQLEKLGMPARGFRGACRYPWQHAMEWWLAYQVSLAAGRRVTYIDINDVLDAADIRNAIANVKIENRMRRDPAFRARMLKAAGGRADHSTERAGDDAELEADDPDDPAGPSPAEAELEA